jgi:hypothetical protein
MEPWRITTDATHVKLQCLRTQQGNVFAFGSEVLISVQYTLMPLAAIAAGELSPVTPLESTTCAQVVATLLIF